MSVTYVIQWKSKLNGRLGKGTKQFSLDEAERLAAELNREYPQIEHSAITAPAPAETPEGQAPGPRPEASSDDQAAEPPVEGEEKMVVTGKRMA
jgi:hypothetical protein